MSVHRRTSRFSLRGLSRWQLYRGRKPLDCPISLRGEIVHSDGILEQGIVAGDDDDAGFGYEVALTVGFGVVADSGAFREMNVAVDNDAADAAEASDSDVSEDDAGSNFLIRV